MSKTKYDHREFMRLYKAGCGDRQIARQTTSSPQNVFGWRKRRGLPAHFPAPDATPKPKQRAQIRKLRSEGLTYGQIAKRIGCSRCAVAGAIHRDA